MYNCQLSGDPLRFADKRVSLSGLQNIRQRVINRTTSIKRVKESSKKKLKAENIKFLKLLGLEVKNTVNY